MLQSQPESAHQLTRRSAGNGGVDGGAAARLRGTGRQQDVPLVEGLVGMAAASMVGRTDTQSERRSDRENACLHLGLGRGTA